MARNAFGVQKIMMRLKNITVRIKTKTYIHWRYMAIIKLF